MAVKSRLPLQPGGWVVVGIGVACLLGSMLLGWYELLVLAAGCLVALLLAVPFVVGRTRVTLTRRLTPERTTVGEPAFAELEAINAGSAVAVRREIHDLLDGHPIALTLPRLSPGERSVQTWPLPTARRGVIKVGPARINKSDPFGLMQRDAGQTGVDTFWVQPRVLPVPAIASGLTKDLDGPTFDTSPAGDVAFHAIRPYQLGDDARHVHWVATARTGEMMVRHYVDNRQPYLSVVLDSQASQWESPEHFDVAVEIAASLGVSALRAAQPVSVHCGPRALVGRGRPSSPQMLLDELTLAEVAPEFELAEALPGLIAAERETTVAVAVTGARNPDELLPAISQLQRITVLTIVLVEPPGNGSDRSEGERRIANAGGARVISVSSLEEFVGLSAPSVVR